MPSKPSSDTRNPTPRNAVEFADLVQAAIADGEAPDGLALALTLRDESEMKRNRAIGLSDISFAGGQMRFLGVRVLRSPGLQSALLRGEDAAEAVAKVDAPPEPPKKAPKAKPPRDTTRAR
ncbi:MAG: hypothetical protein U1E50_17940 [Caulobacteraceae bacterium]